MSIYQLIKKHKITSSVAVLVADGLFILFSDPKKLSAGLVVISFGLVLATLYILCSLALEMGFRLGIVAKTKPKLKWSITVFGFVILVLQSIGQLTLKDVLVLIPLAIGIYLYYSNYRNTISD